MGSRGLGFLVLIVAATACSTLVGVDDVVPLERDAGVGGDAGAGAGGDASAGAAGDAGAGAAGDGGCAPLGLDPDAVYVDAAVASGGTGVAACPLRTITAGLAALAASGASSRALYVAPGTYDVALGEVFPLRASFGVSIIGAGAGVTKIVGGADVSVDPLGGSLQGTYSLTVLSTTTEPVRLTGVTLQPGASTSAAVGVLCAAGNAPQVDPPPSPFPEPNLVIDGAVLGPGYPHALLVTNSASSGCNARITGSTLRGPGIGVLAFGCGYGIEQGPTVAVQVGDGSAAGANTIMDGDYAGVALWGCVEHARVLRNEVFGGKVGIHVDEFRTYVSADLLPIVSGNHVHDCTQRGLLLDNPLVRATVDDNVIERVSGPAGSTARGLAIAAGRAAIRGRRNRVVGNDVGLWIKGGTVDFGTPTDPGDNVFSCNSAAQLASTPGYDVGALGSYAPGAVVSLAGNAWDVAPPSPLALASSGDGHELVVESSGVPALDLSGASIATAACPAGHTP